VRGKYKTTVIYRYPQAEGDNYYQQCFTGEAETCYRFSRYGSFK